MTEREAAAASEREAFEAAMREEGLTDRELDMNEHRNYVDPFAGWAYAAWKARAALSRAPQAVRVPLTEEQILEIVGATESAEPGRDGYILPFTFARAIEAAHGIVPLAPQEEGGATHG